MAWGEGGERREVAVTANQKSVLLILKLTLYAEIYMYISK